MPRTSDPDLVGRVRQMIVSGGYRHNDRLPPERQMCDQLGVTRTRLRTALAKLESDGLIWRHVGRGTFVGARPVLNLEDVQLLRELVTPENVVTARFCIEPELARLAALHASSTDLEQLQTCASRCRAATDWRGYEAWDNNLHHAIARASHNKLFLYMFETLNVVRRSIAWTQPRKTTQPARDYSSFIEHDAVLAAILDRDGERAGATMRFHLESVYSRVLPVLG